MRRLFSHFNHHCGCNRLYFIHCIQPEKKVLTQSEFIAEVDNNNITGFVAEYVDETIYMSIR